MNIILNGSIYNTESRITLHELVKMLNGSSANTNFAIAVNLTIIPRSRYHECWLNENDNVEIVTAFQGG